MGDGVGEEIGDGVGGESGTGTTEDGVAFIAVVSASSANEVEETGDGVGGGIIITVAFVVGVVAPATPAVSGIEVEVELIASSGNTTSMNPFESSSTTGVV